MPNFYLDLTDLLGISNIHGGYIIVLAKECVKWYRHVLVWAIRNQFLSEDGEHVSFSESKEDEEKYAILDTD